MERFFKGFSKDIKQGQTTKDSCQTKDFLKETSKSSSETSKPSSENLDKLLKDVEANVKGLKYLKLEQSVYKANFIATIANKLKDLQKLAGTGKLNHEDKISIHKTYNVIKFEIRDTTDRWTTSTREEPFLNDTAVENIRAYCQAVGKLLD